MHEYSQTHAQFNDRTEMIFIIVVYIHACKCYALLCNIFDSLYTVRFFVCTLPCVKMTFSVVHISVCLKFSGSKMTLHVYTSMNIYGLWLCSKFVLEMYM